MFLPLVCAQPPSVATATSDKKEWTSAGGGSGSGSTLPQTATLRAALPKLVQKYNINSMLDSSCGSKFGMPLVLREIQQSNPGFRFMGTDVVCSLIKKHVETFQNESNWNFQVRPPASIQGSACRFYPGFGLSGFGYPTARGCAKAWLTHVFSKPILLLANSALATTA